MSRPLPVRATWLPQFSPDLVRAGVWFDVIRVPQETGVQALHLLAERGHRSSPAFLDPRGPEPRMYVLIPVTGSHGWNMPGTTALGEGSHVVIPPLEATEGVNHHWYRPPKAARLFIDPTQLRDALDHLATLEAEGGEL
ncbi:hypothetical protein [Streptomyces sp. NPDC057302]|uniref:hypothetical protein n=1 Tax=Streptomyces sp. NPDC057302 TaxID=3346094 RepID=UPI00362E6B74